MLVSSEGSSTTRSDAIRDSRKRLDALHEAGKWPEGPSSSLEGLVHLCCGAICGAVFQAVNHFATLTFHTGQLFLLARCLVLIVETRSADR